MVLVETVGGNVFAIESDNLSANASLHVHLRVKYLLEYFRGDFKCIHPLDADELLSELKYVFGV